MEPRRPRMISSREASPELVKGRIITQEPPFVSTYKSRKPRFFFPENWKARRFFRKRLDAPKTPKSNLQSTRPSSNRRSISKRSWALKGWYSMTLTNGVSIQSAKETNKHIQKWQWSCHWISLTRTIWHGWLVLRLWLSKKWIRIL